MADAVAIPAAIDPTGATRNPSTYTSTTWGADEVGGPKDLSVISSTDSGTAALTGIVLAQATGSPVSGATVTMDPNGGSPTWSTTTNSDGAFGFIALPTTLVPYTFIVSASGFGTYQVVNDGYAANTTYQRTVELTGSSQTYDESEVAADDPQITTAGSSVPFYAAWRKPPPLIRVAIYQLNSNCVKSGGYTVVRYPWRFYVLHVAVAEIDTRWHVVAWRGVAAAIQNYAWWFRRHPRQSDFDVNNSTDYQCFKPERKIPSDWNSWIPDVLNERVKNGSDTDVQLTEYRAGTYNCVESAYPADGNKLSQQGARARDDNCGVNDWRAIIHYYYTGSVTGSQAPPRPNTSHSLVSGGIKFTFPSQVSHEGEVSNVGWTYQVDAHIYYPQEGQYYWTKVYYKGWDSGSRNIPTTWTYYVSQCWRYRARAHNPVAWSQYASFNSDNIICPG